MIKKIVTIEIDQEIKEAARANSDFCVQESKKRGVAPVYLRKDAFYIGFLGEMAARRYFRLPLEVKHYLDLGYDFVVNGIKVDVKTSILQKPLQEPVREGFRFLVATDERLDQVDRILFVRLHPELSKAHLMGWFPKVELPKYPVMKYGKMVIPAYVIYYAYVEGMDTF